MLSWFAFIFQLICLHVFLLYCLQLVRSSCATYTNLSEGYAKKYTTICKDTFPSKCSHLKKKKKHHLPPPPLKKIHLPGWHPAKAMPPKKLTWPTCHRREAADRFEGPRPSTTVWADNKIMAHSNPTGCYLPNSAPENGPKPKRKLTRLPGIHFQVRTVSFRREGKAIVIYTPWN